MSKLLNEPISVSYRLYPDITVDVQDQVDAIMPQVFHTASKYFPDCLDDVIEKHYKSYLILSALLVRLFFGFDVRQLKINDQMKYYSIWRLRMGNKLSAFKARISFFKEKYQRSEVTTINSFAAQLMLMRLNGFWQYFKPFYHTRDIPIQDSLNQVIIFSAIVAPFTDVKHLRLHHIDLLPICEEYEPGWLIPMTCLVPLAHRALPECIAQVINYEDLLGELHFLLADSLVNHMNRRAG